MSLKDCVNKARKAKLVSEEESLELFSRVEGMEKQLEIDLGAELARVRAERLAVQSKIAELKRKKFQKALQIRRTYENKKKVEIHPDGVRRGVMSLLVKDVELHLGKSPWSNVDNRAHAVLGWLHSSWSEGLSGLRTRTLGLTQNRKRLLNVVRELFGKKTGDDLAAEFAKEWAVTAEKARIRFNRAGGNILKRADWGMLQSHNVSRVRKVSADEWVEFTVPLLDKKQMINAETGVPYTDREFGQMMLRMHEAIRTDGLSEMMPGEIGNRKLANMHREHRFLEFKDAEAWIKYQEKFGEHDIFSVMTGHLRRMAHEIANLEVLGPNPDAAYRYFRDLALKSEGDETVPLQFMDSVYDVVSGRADVRQSIHLADFMSGVRHALVASKLGSAMLSAVSDVAFLSNTRLFNGLPATGYIRKMIGQMSPGKEADRKFAVYLGQVAEAWTTRALAAHRFGEFGEAHGVMGKMSEAVLRASLLTPWTDAGRKVFGMEYLKHLADLSGKGFKELPEKTRAAFKNYGITPEDWDLMRSAEMIEHEGISYMRPENSARLADVPEKQKIDLMTKFQEMIATEADFAIPVPSARERAMLTLGKARGTIAGEVARSVGLFRSFSLTVISTHLYRGGLNRLLRGDFKNVRGRYLAGIIISTTVMGALAVQLKQIAKGRDPLGMDDPKFWGRAFVQGGGSGIFGDFLYSDIDRYGHKFTTTALGPVAGLIDDMMSLTAGNAKEALSGQDTKLARDLLKFGKDYMPGGNIWYTRLALERLVFDQLREEVDPKANRAWRRIERRMKKESGQEFWWRPGKTAPSRPPNIESAIGGN